MVLSQSGTSISKKREEGTPTPADRTTTSRQTLVETLLTDTSPISTMGTLDSTDLDGNGQAVLDRWIGLDHNLDSTRQDQ